MKPKISIGMTSYNGIGLIEKQLETLRAQTLQADEVIIADDCSSDGTFEFLQRYIQENNLSGWRVYQNAKNLGAYMNIKTVLQKCSGDYIFPCDQDDEWLPEKIQDMISIMEEHHEIKLLAANYIPVVNSETVNVKLKYLNDNDARLIQLKLNDVWLDLLRPGCTFCFRRELIENFKIFYDDNTCYDSMLWKYAVLTNSLYLLRKPLIKYIRHYENNSFNATGAFLTSPFSVGEKLRGLESSIEFHKKILSLSDDLKTAPENRILLQKKIKFLESRKKILEKKNIFLTALFVLFNMKYYPTKRNALSDIYAVMFLRS